MEEKTTTRVNQKKELHEMTALCLFLRCSFMGEAQKWKRMVLFFGLLHVMHAVLGENVGSM